MYQLCTGKVIQVGKQDFSSGTVDVYFEGQTSILEMHQTVCGDIGFYYEDEWIEFRDIKR